jgi:NTP pyrophosphatase (non-canonical NTP hydrolase)
MDVSLNDIAEACNKTAADHGFWDHDVLKVGSGEAENPSIIAEKLALIHSEVSEALEDTRDRNWDHIGEELADVIIRVLDLTHHLNIDIHTEVMKKMRKNEKRPLKHGRSF